MSRTAQDRWLALGLLCGLLVLLVAALWPWFAAPFAAVDARIADLAARDATASLIQQLETVVGDASPGGRGCAIVNRTPIEDAGQAGRYRRVTVQVRLRCGNAETLAVLHALESARPYLFVDALGITAQRFFAVPGSAQPQEGGLDVNFNLYGYLRPVAGGQRGG